MSHSGYGASSMGLNFALREAALADAETISAVGTAVWINTYVAGEIRPDVARYLATEFSPPLIASLLADTARHWIVAESDGLMVGYAQLLHGATCPNSALHRVELVNLYVLPPFTGRGVGTQLLRAAERSAAAQGEQIWLSVNSGNEKALGFYVHHAYATVGELYFELGGERFRNDVLVKQPEARI